MGHGGVRVVYNNKTCTKNVIFQTTNNGEIVVTLNDKLEPL